MKKIIGRIFLYGCMAMLLLSATILYRRDIEQGKQSLLIKKDIEEKLSLKKTFSEDIADKEKEISDLQLDLKKSEDDIRNAQIEIYEIEDVNYNMIMGKWRIREDVLWGYINMRDSLKDYVGKNFYLDEQKLIFDDTVIFKYPIKYNIVMVPKAQWAEYFENTIEGVPVEESLKVFGSTGEYHISCEISGTKQLSDCFNIERIYIVDDYTLIFKVKEGGFLKAERLEYIDDWKRDIDLLRGL